MPQLAITSSLGSLPRQMGFILVSCVSDFPDNRHSDCLSYCCLWTAKLQKLRRVFSYQDIFFPQHNKMLPLIIDFEGQLIFYPSELKSRVLRSVLYHEIQPSITILFLKKDSKSRWWELHSNLLICLRFPEITSVVMVGIQRLLQLPSMFGLRQTPK